MIKCFYHNKDFDGECSAAIVKEYYGPYIQLIGLNYGDPWGGDSPIEDQITSEDIVVMVDFSLRPFERMLEIQDRASIFIWIDHHKSIIDEASINEKKIEKCSLDLSLSACEQTWKYFFPTIEIPEGVKLLGRYDVWDHAYSNKVQPFEYGMRGMIENGANDPIWDRVFFEESFIEEVVQLGSHILNYQNKVNKWNMKFSFPATIDGIKFICINNAMTGSLQFDSVWDPEKYDAVLVFFRTPEKKWKIRVYTIKEGIDLTKITVKRGGGGHITAGGWTANHLSFLNEGEDNV